MKLRLKEAHTLTKCTVTLLDVNTPSD